jgi:hypothetical protein
MVFDTISTAWRKRLIGQSAGGGAADSVSQCALWHSFIKPRQQANERAESEEESGPLAFSGKTSNPRENRQC